jgi:putative transposase
MAEKKVVGLPVTGKRQQVDPGHAELSIRSQCELLGLARSSWYYEPVPVSAADLALMARLDRWHTDHPFLGSRKLATLVSSPEEAVNRKRVQRLMRLMGLECLFPRPRCTVTSRCHKKYPYLLKGLRIERPGQVWSADITYVPMPTGFMYLVATIDWYSRLVVSWRLSNTLDGSFCQSMLEESLTRGRPGIFNTDQGVQFTAMAWTNRLESAGIGVSMDGVGRCFDNIFVERLWRSVKYEELYPKRYATVAELEAGLTAYFAFYNGVRPHQSLGNRTPTSVHEGG